jgi:hypothetical protein
MILLERLHSRGDASGVSARHVEQLHVVLAALETALLPSRGVVRNGMLGEENRFRV